MKRIDESASASIKWMFSSPGIPKTYLTPSFSRHLTKSLATVVVDSSIGVGFCFVTLPSMPCTSSSRHCIKRKSFLIKCRGIILYFLSVNQKTKFKKTIFAALIATSLQ